MMDFGLLMLLGLLGLVFLLQHRALMVCLNKTRHDDPYAPRERNQ